MFSRSVSLLLLVNLYLILTQVNLSIEIDDVDFANLIEWYNFSIFVCGNESTIEVHLFDCELPMEVLENFDNATCYPTTIQSTQQTTTTMDIQLIINKCPDPNYIGSYCNVTNDKCISMEPCENNAECISNSSYPLGYHCQCLSDEYSGYNCENDNRDCKNDTCWHDGKCIQDSIAIDNKTTFVCLCRQGYEGLNCELVSNMCTNITCENRGACRSSELSWQCHCVDPTVYSGVYCEHESKSLVVKKALGKSFASIAIAAIVVVFLFVIVMDVLKYGFMIDPVERERQLMKDERKKKKKKKVDKKIHGRIAIRFVYIDSSNN
ncbi:unnamed protein product [Adineta ricciae]|uniref:EGF-like domain-containing protein n=1 Tax=Adineta ricciae TaxID=249248 RepID=A0A813PSA7_ADIRI|nr:unnamed protein product [Adineta ricciae]CAF1254748.1 unnamed protein product [Adineta ricciae]